MALLKRINIMIRGIATPLIAVLLILLLLLADVHLSAYPWYSTSLNLLYLAFLFNAVYDCGRAANLVAAGLISTYAIYAIPGEPFRLVVFVLVTFGIAIVDGSLKQRWIKYARRLQRMVDENTRQTEEINRQNKEIARQDKIMAEIAELGEVGPIVARIKEAREIILAYLKKHPDDDLRTALHKLNSAQLSAVGWPALDKAIRQAKSSRDEQHSRAEDLLSPMTSEEIEALPGGEE